MTVSFIESKNHEIVFTELYKESVSFTARVLTFTGDLSACPYNQGVCNSMVFTK